MIIMFDICTEILVACVKPWRYALSSSYRKKINAEYARTNALVKWWLLLRGTVALLLSLVVVSALFWMFLSQENAQQVRHHKIIGAAERGVAKLLLKSN
jgi:hypothetical protein